MQVSVPKAMKNSLQLNVLRSYVGKAALRSFVPYSRQSRAVLVLLSNGDWTCGVRIENSSYSLVIPALSSALASAASLGRMDVIAIVFSSPVKQEEKLAALQSFLPPLDQLEDDILARPEWTYDLRNPLPTCQSLSGPMDTKTGIYLARKAAKYAYTPESNFPVGAIAVTHDEKYFQGSNIEYTDWKQIICAERVAIASVVSAGHKNIKHLYVSCPNLPTVTPCGACRQVLHEIAPTSTVYMDRGEKPPEQSSACDLLPKAFRINSIHH